MPTGIQTILDLVQARPIDIDALEEAFEQATHGERVAATRQFDGKIQAALWDAAAGRGVSFGQIVPTEERLQEVIHVGTNTLPAFRAFEKRFCRAPVSDVEKEKALGYNHNWFWPVTSPGYYVAYECPDTDEFCIDYTEMPTEKPEEWPPLLPNWFGLGVAVYFGMVDRLRRVSTHVTIGRAFKKKPMNAWFVLVRDDTSY